MPKPGKKIIFTGQWPLQNIVKAKTACNNIGDIYHPHKKPWNLYYSKRFLYAEEANLNIFLARLKGALQVIPAIIKQTIDSWMRE